MLLVVISGLSGSGKSIALKVLEDSGFFCVDNLPSNLLTQLTEYLRTQGHSRVAVAVDVRGGSTISALPEAIDGVRAQGVELRMVFLDARADTLIARFSETRRRHPLASEHTTLAEAIQAERDMLEYLSQVGHHIDTSALSPTTLRAWMLDFVESASEPAQITLLFESFGFKYGIPMDADMVFDVRCLPNPHYDPQLRPLTGRDKPVIDFLEAEDKVLAMLADIRGFIDTWLPCYVRDARAYLTVAIGCTGGKHRSVYFVEQLASHFRNKARVLVRHRSQAA